MLVAVPEVVKHSLICVIGEVGGFTLMLSFGRLLESGEKFEGRKDQCCVTLREKFTRVRIGQEESITCYT